MNAPAPLISSLMTAVMMFGMAPSASADSAESAAEFLAAVQAGESCDASDIKERLKSVPMDEEIMTAWMASKCAPAEAMILNLSHPSKSAQYVNALIKRFNTDLVPKAKAKLKSEGSGQVDGYFEATYALGHWYGVAETACDLIKKNAGKSTAMLTMKGGSKLTVSVPALKPLCALTSALVTAGKTAERLSSESQKQDAEASN